MKNTVITLITIGKKSKLYARVELMSCTFTDCSFILNPMGPKRT